MRLAYLGLQGDVVYSYAGRDATEAFRALHKNPVGAGGPREL